MHSWQPIKTVLNRVPSNLLDEESKIQMLSWAFEFLRDHFKHFLLDAQFAVIPLSNNNGKLPVGLIQLHDAFYSRYLPPEECSELVEDEMGVSYYWIHSVVNARNYLSENTVPMVYKGQNPKLLNHSMISYYCRQCEVGFSVDKMLKCITTDMSSGYAIIAYSTYAKEGDSYLVPDIPELFQSLNYYIQYKYWENKAIMKEEGAYQLSQDNYRKALFHKDRAKTRYALRNVNIEKLRNLMYERANIRLVKDPSVTGDYKNRR